ncbi:MAG: DUF2835 family protein [Oceanisphaera sp.]|uniref:DUF2835 family protein n=1 Tax=Oceanisphaera sp. TaxID=1929979 RepID=UPI003F97E393
MKKLRFRVAISRAQLLQYYQGRTGLLLVTTEQGVRLKVALHHFRTFVSHNGLHGHFEIELSPDNKLQRITLLS